MSKNPNNCDTCEHRKNEVNRNGGKPPVNSWCYMFRDEPTSVCAQHTGRQLYGGDARSLFEQVFGK